jgi:pyruvate/2-oxoglutarate dehydrogenase complex dihydrolipoamide acyltransferase (E2) component
MSDHTTLLVPRSNPNDETVTILEWRLESGAAVRAGDKIVEVETSKATLELEATEDGFLFYTLAEGEQLAVGDPIAYIARAADFVPPSAASKEPPRRRREDRLGTPAGAIVSQSRERKIAFTRKAQRLVREHGLSESLFADLDLVREEDVLQRLSRRESSPGSGSEAFAPVVPFTTQKLPPTKAFEIRQLAPGFGEIFYSRVEREVPLELTERVRAAYLRREGLQLTTGELLCFACARSLARFPLLNAWFAEGSIRLYQEINLGVAMNVADAGLKVPVIRRIDGLSLREVSLAVKSLSMKYMRGKLTVEDLTGGTFTVTDLSSAGVVSFDPVINYGQSAILGVCAPRLGAPVFGLVVAFDHRVLDGMIAAQFAADLVGAISTVAEELERP